jgi:hypothetical protein
MDGSSSNKFHLLATFIISGIIIACSFFFYKELFPNIANNLTPTTCTILNTHKELQKIHEIKIDFNDLGSKKNKLPNWRSLLTWIPNVNIPFWNDELVVNYSVNNQERQGNLIHFDNDYYHHDFKKWQNRFKIGQQIPCFYLKDENFKVTLLTHYNLSDLNYGALLDMAIIFLVLIIGLIYSILSYRKSE